MPERDPGRPLAAEYLDYYDLYIRLVPQGPIVDLLGVQISATGSFFSSLTETQARWRPAAGEWSAHQILGHLADGERVFAYRALRFARADATPLPGFDVEAYPVAADCDRRSMADLVAEFTSVRAASLSLLASLESQAWLRRGAADGNVVSVRALAYIMAGHELHHVADLTRQLSEVT
ncbi:MAG: DinB family protein [Thermomicrobiales bacterium]